jgi:geranylgeranyl transferase type-1 subunit beta
MSSDDDDDDDTQGCLDFDDNNVRDEKFPVFEFSILKQSIFFSNHLLCLHKLYVSIQTSRLMPLYFVLGALDVMGTLDAELQKKGVAKKQIIDWVYSLQLHPNKSSSTGNLTDHIICGFRGGPFVGVPFDAKSNTRRSEPGEYPHDHSHIAMTYCALCILVILGDDLSRVNKKDILNGLKLSQTKNGRYALHY